MIVDLSVSHRHVVIVGAGKVAYRKACSFQKEKAIVTIIAPNISDACKTLNDVVIIERPFSWDLLDELPFMIYVACDDEALHEQIYLEARKRRVLFGSSLNMQADIHSMLQAKREHVQLGISTRGYCPSAARAFLRQLDSQLVLMDEMSEQLHVVRQCLLKRHVESVVIREIIQKLAVLDEAYSRQMVAALEGSDVILLAVHGVADLKRSQAALSNLCALTEAAFSCAASYVFISEKITKKAQQKGYRVAHVGDLVAMYGLLSIRVVIQPLLFSEKVQFTLLKKYAANTRLLRPLFADKDVQRHLFDRISGWYSEEDIVCLAHEEVLKLNERDRLRIISLDDEKPNEYPDVCHLIPLFLLYGYHMRQDVEKRWLPIYYANCDNVIYSDKGLLEYEELHMWIISEMKERMKE